MRILLFGEFSGLHRNLKEGLLELGHEVVIASGLDGYKMIRGDINLDKTSTGILGKIESHLKPFFALNKLQGYDVIQTVNPFYPNAKLFPKQFFYSILRKHNSSFFMLAAGSDAFYWRYGPERLRYSPFKDFLKYDVKSDNYYMQHKSAYSYNRKIADLSDGVIPVMYDYEVCYEGCEKRLNTIPLPVNVDKIEYRENVVGNKLVVFHGLSRYGLKGTRHVEAAYEELASRYPRDLELIIDGQLPLDEYLELMRRTNVVIDQVNSYSLGMNGVYALAMGKAVIGGAEPEGLKSLGVDSSSVMNATPDKQSIIRRVEELLENRHRIADIGADGRNFVEANHSHIKVAGKYVETWKSIE